MSPYLSLIFHLCNLPPLSFSWWNPMYCSEWYKHKPIHFREILLGSPTAAGAVGTPCGTRVVFTSRSSVSCGVADTPQVLGGSSYWVSGESGYSQSPTRRGFPFLQTTTIMQQLHCDLQPESQQTNRTTHTWTTTRCRTQWRNRSFTESSAAAPAAHTRYLSSPAAATLHGKTQGFVLRLSPQNKPHATFMQPLHCNLQPESQEYSLTLLIVMWCKPTHHLSVSIVSHFSLCDVKLTHYVM